MSKVTLYSKSDCPLCAKAEKLLRKLQREFRYEMEVIDITSDQALFERYCFDIPVIAIDGVERVRGRLSEEELRAAWMQASLSSKQPG